MHLPVLLKEVTDYLDLASGNVVLDATLGGGGHTEEALKRILPGGKLIAVDKDSLAIERVKGRLKEFEANIVYVNDDFRNVDDILKKTGTDKIDGAIFDLGLSSFQVDDEGRGFSFLKDGPLDMRFNTSQDLSARDIVNKFSKEQLTDIIKDYGEERYARPLAEAICTYRRKRRIETTGELTDIIVKTVGKKYGRQKIHPACRTFQALRICVNDELSAASEAVDKTLFHLKPKGRICVISFHSLEDRIIKNIFRDRAKSGEIAIITKKPVTPDISEIRVNSRSRSAKLRVAERII